ncbi:MAG: serine protease Do [Kiritimatiellia bacterium]|jgi:serine protease Do
MVEGNAMDLNLFQFDYDMSFAGFFMNADKTIYGRYGTRATRPDEADKYVSLTGLRAAMTGALTLHKNVANYRPRLAGKTGPPSKQATPLDYASIGGKFKDRVDYASPKVAGTCVHCHQIQDAMRKEYRLSNQPIPDRVLYPWPMPDIIGLACDPDTRGTVTKVTPGTPAAKAGFRVGDVVLALNGQPILSLADIQWVLHNAEPTDTIKATVRRAGKNGELNIQLPVGWREKTDISWRTSSWDLRRMLTGGISFDAPTSTTKLELPIKNVGKYNDHAVAKNAGIRAGDVVVEWNGKTDPMNESELFAYTIKHTKVGDMLPVKVRRSGKVLEMKIRMQ